MSMLVMDCQKCGNERCVLNQYGRWECPNCEGDASLLPRPPTTSCPSCNTRLRLCWPIVEYHELGPAWGDEVTYEEHELADTSDYLLCLDCLRRYEPPENPFG